MGARDVVDALHVRRDVLAIEDPHLYLARGRLSVDRALVLRRDVGALRYRFGEARRSHEAQPKALAERFEDALAVAHRGARRVGADGADELVVARQGAGVKGAPTTLEVAACGGIEALVGGGDPIDHRVHHGRRVPQVRIRAAPGAHRVRDIEHRAPCGGAGAQQAPGPAVVAEPVDDHQLGVGQRARVARVRFVVVRVAVRIGDDARHARACAG